MIVEAKTRYALPIRTLAAQMRLSVASLSRWKRRLRRGEVAAVKRGPRKVKPLNLSELTERIRGLEHSKKRSRGSGLLHRMYGGGISRRELNAMVRQVRNETNRLRCVETSHVTWLRANLAWAMDDCLNTRQAVDGSLHLHNLTDLHSR
jgi:transposase